MPASSSGSATLSYTVRERQQIEVLEDHADVAARRAQIARRAAS